MLVLPDSLDPLLWNLRKDRHTEPFVLPALVLPATPFRRTTPRVQMARCKRAHAAHVTTQISHPVHHTLDEVEEACLPDRASTLTATLSWTWADQLPVALGSVPPRPAFQSVRV